MALVGAEVGCLMGCFVFFGTFLRVVTVRVGMQEVGPERVFVRLEFQRWRLYGVVL
jgi:hypothetical protein